MPCRRTRATLYPDPNPNPNPNPNPDPNQVMRPPAGQIASWHDLYLVTELFDSDLHQVIKSEQELSDEHCRWFTWQLL